MFSKGNQLQRQLRDLENLPHPFKTKMHLPFFRKKVKTVNQQQSPNSLNSRKHFFFDSEDTYIKDVLVREGWILRRNVLDCNFVWVYNLHKIPYQPKPHQRINHYKDSWILTSKQGLRNTLYKNSSVQTKVDTFYPRTYNLESESLQFKSDYLLTAVLVILKKLIVYFKTLGISGNSDRVDFTRFTAVEKKFEESSNSALLLPKCLLLYEILLLQKHYRFQQGTMEDSESFLFQVSEQNIQSLLAFSKRDLPYNLSYPQTVLGTPSTTTINLLFQYHSYFKRRFSYYQSDGFNNIWIIKHSEGSKGQGIELVERVQDIRGGNCSLRVVQKYIQNIWVFTESQLEEYSEIPKGLQKLVNRKFDIRIWVLVTEVEPIVAYMFQQGTVRISSEEYSLNRLRNLCTHLTNYSINKQNFKDKQESYLLLSTLTAHLKWKYNHTSLLAQIQSIVVKTLQCTDISPCKQSFELFGFDLILDSQLNPWLLEVNMSPACKSRGELTEVRSQMARGMLELLGVIEVNKNQSRKRMKWIKVIEEKREPKNSCKMEVYGRNMNRLELGIIQTKIERHQAATKIQRLVKQKITFDFTLSRQDRVACRMKSLIGLLHKLISARKRQSLSRIMSRGTRTEVPRHPCKQSNYRSRLLSKLGAVQKQKLK